MSPAPKRLRTFKAALILALLAGFPSAAFATISNDGNDAVQIKISKRTGFSQSYTLYPGQSIAIPEGSTEVKVEPRGFGTRGDEKISVKVVAVTGEDVTLDGYGQTYRLDKDPEEAQEDAAVKLAYGKVLNAGNNTVDVDLKDDKGIVNRRVIYPGQPLSIAPNTVEVRVAPNSRMRGDEIVKVEVVMPDGEEYTISRLGGIAKLVQD